jgi:steroid 5-alpha reductase family enzyme
MSLLLESLPFVLALTLLLWPVSLALRDASIIDIYWAPAFAVTAWFVALRSPYHGIFEAFGLSLVSLWGLRLGLHIFLRHRWIGEDPRYGAMREKFGRHWWWWSLFQVFLLQAILIWLISWPLQFLVTAENTAPLVCAAGLVLAAAGFCFEAIADFQLTGFRNKPANKGTVMKQGVWRWSRHPNYFGDCSMWWGFFIAGLGAGAPWWTVLAPVAMTLLLLKISGITLMEESIIDRRPGYADYIARTSAFIPWPPKS